MATSVQPLCLACRHLDRQQMNARVCSAFSDGIPDDIWMNRRDHRDAYPGDHNIQFELAIITADMLVKTQAN